MVSVLFALLTALANGLASVFQRMAASTAPAGKALHLSLFGYLIKHRIWLAGIGLSLECLGVDFHTAENELEQQAIGMYLAVSRRAHSVLCSASDTLTIHYTSGLTAEVRPEDRELIRAKLAEALDTDWRGYVTTALAAAQPAA